ncbi:hypothetical protein ACLMJK_002377 [Lecanora helva]
MLSKHLIHRSRNRSQVSLEPSQEPQDRRAYGESPLHSPGFPPQSASSQQYHDRDEDHDQAYRPASRSEEARYYQLSQPTSSQPTRSKSTRSPGPINTNQPTIQLVHPHGSASSPSSAVEDDPDRYYQQGPPPPTHKADTQKKKRSFFGLGSSSSSKDAGKIAPPKLGRSISVRRKEEPQPPAYGDLGNYDAQQERWPPSEQAPSNARHEDDNSETAGRPQYAYTQAPALLDNDPLRSPAFPPPLSHEEYAQGRQPQQGQNQNSINRQPLDRKGSYQSSWEKATQQVNKHSRTDSVQQGPSSYQPSPSSATSASSHPFAHRSQHENLHQYYHENSRPPSQQSLEPPQSSHHPRGFEYSSRQGQSSVSSAEYIQSSMGPVQGQQPPVTRRSSESTQQSQSGSQSREGGSYQPYNQGVQQGSVLSPNAPPPQYSAQLAPQGQNHRGSIQTSPMAQQAHREPGGRNTPPPTRSRDDLAGTDHEQMTLRYEELQDKYRKVKKYYFDKDAQVLQLQNTLAVQRLAQSRTSLDDNEYANRFQRLDGAINNLAFNLRRDWRSVPPWLAPHVNRDAASQPTKEMTAVGRACIARWLVDEIFERYFHPAIEPAFSSQLKIIEKNLRRFAAPTPSDEEKDALLARISNWRLSTLDGLQEVLSSPQATENRTVLTENLVEKLTASLSMMLKEPTPPGLEGGVSMIVELAIGIAANLPLESRDVFVGYVTPGSLVQDTWMKVESGLPPLVNPGDGPTETETVGSASKQNEETGSIESKETGTSGGTGNEDASKEGTMQQQQQQQQPTSVQAKKKSMFGGLMGSSGTKKGSIGGGSALPGSQAPPQAQVQQQPAPPKEDRVRFSTFMAVEVRGRNVLVKAPVYLREQ